MPHLLNIAGAAPYLHGKPSSIHDRERFEPVQPENGVAPKNQIATESVDGTLSPAYNPVCQWLASNERACESSAPALSGRERFF
jgi:hypothetical protein